MLGNKSEIEKTPWQVLQLTQIEPLLLFKMLQLRQQVFMLEQQCLYADMDELDITALHVFLQNEKSDVIACARLIAPCGDFLNPRIGRLIVAMPYRGKGLAYALLAKCVDELQKIYPQMAIDISAQYHLKGFYQKAGFGIISEPYDEDGIVHIDMRRENKGK